MIPSSLLLTARKLSVDATTSAALEDSPEPAGTAPDTSMSTGVGSFAPSLKKLFNTPWEEVEVRTVALGQMRERT